MKPIDVTINDYQDMVALFHGESERGAAVLVGSYIENFLGIYLQSKMADQSLSEKIFGTNGPLSSFSQRIDFAPAFGLLSPIVCKELHLIRKIRNHFAHHPKEASFSTSPAREWVGSMIAAQNMPTSEGQNFKLEDEKLVYLVSAGMLVVTISNSQ